MALTTVPASLSATALTLTTAAQPNITSLGTLTGLTIGGNLTLSGASSPKITITDTTNTVSLLMYSQDAEAIIGTYTNHPLKLFSNSSVALTFDTSQNATFAGTIAGTLATAAQTNITSVGTLTGLTVSGNVGIGNARTDGTLHVLTASAGTVAASTQADDIVIENNAEGGMTIITPDDQSARIRFTSPSTNNAVGGASIFYRQNINKMNIGTEVSGGILALHSGAGSETMRLDANGNVGIGVTPDTYTSSAYRAIQIAGYAYNIGHSGGDHYLTNNAYINSGWKYGQTSTAQLIQMASGKIGLYTAASGSADSAITWNTGLVQDSSGNVGIGTSSPAGTLHLKSTATGATPSLIFENTNNAQTMNIDYYNNSGSVQSRIRYSEGPGSFEIIPNASANAAMVLLYNGNVGIGTTSPSALLNVNTASSGSHDAIIISRTTHGTVGTLKNASGSLEVISNKQLVLASDPGNAFTAAGSLIDFQIDGGSKMTFNSSSQLYIPSGRVQAGTALMGTVSGHAMFGSNSVSEPIVFSRDFSISYPDLAISVYGDIGIGTTSPTQHNNYNTLTIADGGIGSIIELFGYTTNHRHLIYNNNGQMIISADHGNVVGNSLIYLQTDGTNRMTVSDTSYPGYVKVNGSAGALIVAPSGVVQFYATQSTPGIGIYQDGAYSSCGAHMEFACNANVGWSPIYINKYNVGSSTDTRWISFGVNGYNTDSATIAYNYSTGNFSLDNPSDYRIKENVVNYSGGLEKIEALRVVSYNKINSTANTKIEGFIAHELQEVIPAAVSGEKDAMKVNEEGETVPDYQMLSKETLVPYLVSAIQELSAEVKALKAKLGE